MGLSVVGLGLLGGSIGLAVKEHAPGIATTGYDRDAGVLETAKELDIHPVYLPTYASWLNPIEKLWRWLKADVLHGHEFAHNIQLLHQTVTQFLDQFSSPSPALLRYVGLLPD